VCAPAVIAALLFRGGLVQRLAGVTFVRRDGRPASRVRLFWRSIVAWSPLWLAPFVLIPLLDRSRPADFNELPFMIVTGLLMFLAAVSIALPGRGLPDRLAGTWPVPR
jgi:hypothetical protein